MADGLNTTAKARQLDSSQQRTRKGGKRKGNETQVARQARQNKRAAATLEQQTDKFIAYYDSQADLRRLPERRDGWLRGPGAAVDMPAPLVNGQIQGPGAPQISPQQAAYVAVAQLRLTPPKPVIGPSPEINEWHMAAVGYPYWLWAEGNLDPAPVSTTVADLTVSLDAHLQSTTFDLGDGSRITCTDLSARWTPAVEPAAPSPGVRAHVHQAVPAEG